MKVLNCHSRSDDRVARELSNLYPHPFVLDDIECGSMEGFLQSLKFPDIYEKKVVASLSGTEAFFTGQHGNGWKEKQTLTWWGTEYKRSSKKYQALLTRAYDACFESNVTFVAALIESGNCVLAHDMGKTDPTKTTLTQMEYLVQLYRLRAIARQMVGQNAQAD